MEELCSPWFYQESIDELRQTLQYTAFELEALRAKANEDTRLRGEEVKDLLRLLKLACRERDEAKDHLQSLLKKQSMSHHDTADHNAVVLAVAQNPKSNSSVTESNSLSLGSSPVDDSFFFDPVASPEFSNFNNVTDPVHGIGFGNRPINRNCNPQRPFAQNYPSMVKMIDPVEALIDEMVKGEVLPVKGRLLKTVTESGPLLQTLLLAGALPQWRNPPPMHQTSRVRPISYEVSRGLSSSQMRLVSSTLNFRGCSVSGISPEFQVAKRQRLI
ncbi:PREDICTED: uncharacterized protein LOC104826341 [Tarenaya hassleriana]|uniref:uncharacterized protein LOC104826341 n=1 Tax=Tarenaya hassleriana TaxID=28532 RepID=UPI00053C27E7|nr:PREDICTED: uncharacterized protein LOC104826341 [Tarenaya hassleriana]